MHKHPHVVAARVGLTRHGIVTWRQLLDAGLTEKQIRHLAVTGALDPLWSNVYRVAGVQVTWRGTLLAACFAGGVRAVASHRSAAAVRDLPGGDQRLQELTCPRWRRARHSGLFVHESTVLEPCDLDVVDGIPATSVERTLFDLGAVRSRAVVERAVEAALRREMTTLPAIDATLRRLGRRGRPGSAALRAVLDGYARDRNLTESDMEMLLVQVLRRNGLPEPVLQYVISDNGRFVARVDAALVEWKIAIEYESFQYHTGRTALIRDSARRNAQIAIGWRPISVTWEDLRTGGRQVCADIRSAMRRAA
jgi:hypothetical protein